MPFWFLGGYGDLKSAFDCPTGYKGIDNYGPISMPLLADVIHHWKAKVNTWDDPHFDFWAEVIEQGACGRDGC